MNITEKFDKVAFNVIETEVKNIKLKYCAIHYLVYN